MEEGKLGRRHASASCQNNELEEAGNAGSDSWKGACSPTQWSSAWGDVGELFIQSCSLQATVKLQLVFLIDGRLNEPVYRGPSYVAITPVINIALHKTTTWLISVPTIWQQLLLAGVLRAPLCILLWVTGVLRAGKRMARVSREGKTSSYMAVIPKLIIFFPCCCCCFFFFLLPFGWCFRAVLYMEDNIQLPGYEIFITLLYVPIKKELYNSSH